MATRIQTIEPVYTIGLLGATVVGNPMGWELEQARIEEIERRILAIEAIFGLSVEGNQIVRGPASPVPLAYRED